MDNNHVDKSPYSNDSSEGTNYVLEQPSWSLDGLKTAAIQHRLLRPRSLAWAILLNALPPPNADIISSLKTHRNFYNDLMAKLSMDPRSVIGDDPLSQNDESVWKQHFCDNELKNVILQDVVRTYPDELYFRDKDVQDMMVRVLFFWSRSHSNIGYRQGMHEILAPALFELFLDRKCAPHNISEKLKRILDEDYLEHDSFMLFSAIMKGLEKFYTTGDVVPTASGRMPASRTVHNPNEVVRYLDRVREEYLLPLDNELASHLARCNISLELFGIRWLRLLFGREFPRSEVPHLWGFLFSEGPLLPHIQYVVVAMLIAMRTSLVGREPGAVLSCLMRPVHVSVGHVCALTLHLRHPMDHPRPPPYTSNTPSIAENAMDYEDIEQTGSVSGVEGEPTEGIADGVALGADVAMSLGTLALLRAQLPPAAAALAAALPRAPPAARQPLKQILHLAALLQCRNHALIDVETALEAGESHSSDKVGRRQLVPVVIATKQNNKPVPKVTKVKEVPLQVFHQVECESGSDLPFMDPLRLRTE